MTTTQTRQSAAEKSTKGPTRAGNPKLSPISTADCPACGECHKPLEPRKHARGLCMTCYQYARRHRCLDRCCALCGSYVPPRRFVRGLCMVCYERSWRRGTLPEISYPTTTCACGRALPKDKRTCWACYGRARRGAEQAAREQAARDLAAHWGVAA